MSKPIRFDNKVVIVTGAGNGLGKEYALYFAEKGAKVVVNDLGGSHTGAGQSSAAAQKVVDQIKSKGGIAVANFDSVEFGDKIVKTAMDAFGRVDVVINNAGILRDVSFAKMKDIDWDLIMKVHLKGTYSVAKAAWNIMREQGYGRIVNTSSSSGLYGSFGQANYSAAKLGVHGLTMTLAKEGEKRNIRTNTICPVAASRMTQTVLPQEALDKLSPAYIIPLVAWLSHEDCEETGSLFEVAGGFISKLRWNRTEGHLFDLDNFTVEAVRDNWEKVIDFEKNEYPTGAHDTFAKVTENVERMNEKKEGSTSANASEGASVPTEIMNSKYKSDQIFYMMQQYLAMGHGKDLPKKISAIFGFNIIEKKNGPVVRGYTIDLKNGEGKVTFEPSKTADAIFTMIDGDFEQVCMGKLNPQNAFMTGKMKIKGNMGKATKFTPDLFPPPTPENIAKYAKAKL